MISTTTALAVLAATAGLVSAAPLAPRADDIDTTILQYALTLEHLENAFYSEALSMFDADAFASVGYKPWVRDRVVQIGQHEASHVAFLQTALGDAATKPCNYSFGLAALDPKGFLGLSSVIENVGVSAYLGAASKITNPDYITAAGAILTVEARHQAWITSVGLSASPWNGPYDTPLGFSDVYSIAAAFITSCPDTNPTLPVKAFPAATVKETSYAAGDKITLDFPTTGNSEALVVYSELKSFFLPIASDETVTLPEGLQGIAYGVITTAGAAANVSDENTVAGPVIFNFGLTSTEVSS
ncbi:Ferritin-like superfamily [Phaffia rhodozyma]|uniref:Ferritin-like superfamily n=1 Tax=Phaffia rhodozyma TaxID=264483 RepID=A0A0F7SM03_PHARH|nr:Ferritin-like superfamily [Phaffia rhodozyma]